MTSTVMDASAARPSGTVTRLLVTVRDPDSHAYRSVGFLRQESGGYSFAYLRREVERENFRPLPGLSRAAAQPMQSSALFPLFAERVISARRPDRQESLEALGLPMDAAPFEVLVRSHGQRVGDTIELLPAPEVAPGAHVSFTFLAHGVRYLPEDNQNRITTLAAGDPLLLCPDAGNPVNPRAQLVTDTDNVRLGWMPDPLIEVVDAVEDRHLTVERSNGPEVGFHFRLLVRLQGQLPNGVGLFTEPEWTTVGN